MGEFLARQSLMVVSDYMIRGCSFSEIPACCDFSGLQYCHSGLTRHHMISDSKSKRPTNPILASHRSAPSRQRSWVSGLEFDSGVIDFHLPVNASLRGVDFSGPRGCFLTESLFVRKTAAIDALAGE